MDAWSSRLAPLPLHVDSYTLEGLELATASGFVRHTTLVRLRGGGFEGVGEDVTYDAGEQQSFQQRGPTLPLAGTTSLAGFCARLDRFPLFPAPPPQPAERLYRRWAFESAALDLALRQAGRSFAEVLGRKPQPVRFVVSLGLGDPPRFERLDALAARVPGLDFKVDYAAAWRPETVEALAARPVAVVDYKGLYRGAFEGPPPDAEMYRRIAEGLPDVWLEDAFLGGECGEALAPFRERLTWDAKLHAWSDILALPFLPRCVNIKPSRFGGIAPLVRCLELCERRGIAMYGGGQFELGPGRGQLQLLASLFYPDAPNDVAPSAFNAAELPEELPETPLPVAAHATGFGWG